MSVSQQPLQQAISQQDSLASEKYVQRWGLNPLSSRDSFPFRSTNTEDGAELDIKAQKVWDKSKQPTFFDVRIFNSLATSNCTSSSDADTNGRRGEHTNSVSLRWRSMVPLLLWSCPQAELGVLLPRWPSRDSQVSSLRNTANRTAAPSTSSDVISPSA